MQTYKAGRAANTETGENTGTERRLESIPCSEPGEANVPTDNERSERAATSLQTNTDTEENEEAHNAIAAADKVTDGVSAAAMIVQSASAFTPPTDPTHGDSQRADERACREDGSNEGVAAGRKVQLARVAGVWFAEMLEEIGHLLHACSMLSPCQLMHSGPCHFQRVPEMLPVSTGDFVS